jgi:hypothetical protein
MQSRAEGVNAARMQGKPISLPGETCCWAVKHSNPGREARLKQQESAEVIVPDHKDWEGPNIEWDEYCEQFVGRTQKAACPG